jgi:hypothetical protein
LGATQGFAAGVVIALVLLALQAWRQNRSERTRVECEPASGARKTRHWTWTALWLVVSSLAVVVSGGVSCLAGAILGQQQLYQRWTDQKLREIATILEPGTFPHVRAGYSSAAQVFLTGHVSSEAELESLREKLIAAFGTREAQEILRMVDTHRSVPQPDRE